MSEPLENPSLVLCLGRFGDEVAGLLVRDGPAPPNLVVTRVSLPPGPDGRLVEELSSAARGLLDLRQRVETTGAADARPPRLDVLVVGDLAEDGVATLVPGLCERLGLTLREDYRPIFAGSGGRLTVCPVLAMPRSVRDRSEVRAAIDALDALARAPDERRRPQAPIYLVEDQSARYVLSPDELMRTVASFLHLVLFSGLRHREDALKSLLEQDGEPERPFATFGCATLEFDTRPLEAYCAGRIAVELAEAMLEEQQALADAEGAAKRLSPEALLAAALARGPNDRPLVEELRLDRAALELRDPGWRESPEEVEALLSPYLGRVVDAATKQRQDIEGFRMEAAARRVDEGGLDVLRRVEEAIDAEVARCLAESPAGAERARLRLEALEARLKRLEEQSRTALDKPELPPLPEPARLRSAEQAAREALERRPRLGRMATWGVLGSGLLALFLAAMARLSWRSATTEVAPFFSPGVRPEGWAGYLVGWPFVAGWAALVGAAWVAWTLWRHHRSEHRVLLERFEGLRRAAREYYTELERYFARRVTYSQDLWAARVARHLLARVQGERALLEGARASLQKGRDRLAEALRAQEAAVQAAGRSGVLFRGLLSGDDLAAIYSAKARPQSAPALAQAFLAEATARGDWRGGCFGDVEAVLEFARRICPDLSHLRPFVAEPGWSAQVRSRGAEFLTQLAAKLSVPLELVVDAGERHTVHLAYVPQESRTDVESVLRSEDLTRRWVVREAADERRMHLFVATREISRASLGLFASPGAEGGR